MNRGKLFGAVFLLLALPLVWLGFDSPYLISKGLLFCSAFSSGALGLAYVWSRPGFLGKTAQGRIGLSRYAVFWPYHLLSYGSLFLARLLRVEPFQEIVPGLFLGGRLLLWEAKRAAPLAKAGVLDLTTEFCEVGFLRRSNSYLCVPLLDGTAPSRADLELGVRFITEQLQKGPVYVHCAMGHGRGATFAIAYLLASGKAASFEQAFQLVKSKRSGVKIRPGQRRALKDFEHARRNL